MSVESAAEMDRALHGAAYAAGSSLCLSAELPRCAPAAFSADLSDLDFAALLALAGAFLAAFGFSAGAAPFAAAAFSSFGVEEEGVSFDLSPNIESFLRGAGAFAAGLVVAPTITAEEGSVFTAAPLPLVFLEGAFAGAFLAVAGGASAVTVSIAAADAASGAADFLPRPLASATALRICE